MTWLKNKLLWIMGAITALVFFYLLGRRDGKNVESSKQKEKTIRWASVARRIDNMPNDDIDRLPSKYD